MYYMTSNTPVPSNTQGTVVNITRKKKVNPRPSQVPNSVRKFYSSRCASMRGALPENPVKEYRLSKGLTIKQFAQHIGMSEHAIIRTEQGFYLEPSTKLVQEIGYSLSSQYEMWQNDVRQHHYRLFGNILEYSFPNNEHPLDILYENWTLSERDHPSRGNNPFTTPVGTTLNDTEVCKLLCLNQSVVHYWHNKVQSQQTVPSQFLEALSTNGYNTEELALVSAAYMEYRKKVSSPVGASDGVKFTKAYKSVLDEIKEELL